VDEGERGRMELLGFDGKSTEKMGKREDEMIRKTGKSGRLG